MFDLRFFFLCTPLFVLLPLWIGLARHYRTTNRTTVAAIACASAVALWACSLEVRIILHPSLLNAPPWEGVNLDAAWLGLIGPIAAGMGIFAAIRGARWWQVLLVELSAIPLTLIGCAAGISV